IVIALLRGLPEILVVLLIYFGSTQIVEMLTGEYIEFSAFGCGVFALSLIFASYASQTLRGAIQAIPKGQWESGAALG
ncbi:amino acid ABC transporter permease, partial [Neisseria sp. P0003.S003]